MRQACAAAIISSTLPPRQHPMNITFRTLSISLSLLLLAACGTTPPAPQPAKPQIERFKQELGEGFSVEYQLERKQSSLNHKACYSFITGTVINRSENSLSRRSVLDVSVFSQGRQLFRDLTHPVSDIAPGGRAMFEMVSSPVFREGCPAHDRITISLRKIAGK
jgi:hypothetical protein